MLTLRLTRLTGLRLSAASALVCQEGRLWVLADDQLHLHGYSLAGELVAERPLLPGALPLDAAARKAAKPDFEALTLLPNGALLALGSGSTAARRRGCLIHTDAVEIIDLSPLYSALESHCAELNLEGAVVRGEHLLLAQRGNGVAGQNALILLDLRRVLADLAEGRLSAASLLRVVPVELGELEGVPLGLTDLALDSRGRLYFSAAAEASASTYLDGHCAGSLLGRFAEDFSLAWSSRLAPQAKIEGLAFQADGRLLLVADPDDSAVPAPLFALDELEP